MDDKTQNDATENVALNLKVPNELKARLKALAQKSMSDMSTLARQFVEAGINNAEAK